MKLIVLNCDYFSIKMTFKFDLIKVSSPATDL